MHALRLSLGVDVGHDHVAVATVEGDRNLHPGQLDSPVAAEEDQVVDRRAQARSLHRADEVGGELALVEWPIAEGVPIAGQQREEGADRDIGEGGRHADRAADQVSERLAHLIEQRCRRHEQEGVAEHGVVAAGRADPAEHDAGRHALRQFVGTRQHEGTAAR